MKRPHRALLILLAIFLLLPLLTACDVAVSDLTEAAKKDTAKLMDAVIAGDKKAYLDLLGHIDTEEKLSVLWEAVTKIFQGAKTYEIKVTGFSENIKNGVTTAQATLTVTADTDTTMAIRMTYDGELTLIGVYMSDVTETEGTGYTTAKLLLLLMSIAFFAFSIWMLTDAIKRPISHKILWIVIVLINVGITLSENQILWSIRPLFFMSSYTSTASSFSLALGIPIGAILYFFLRKKITPPKPKAEPQNPYYAPQNPYAQMPPPPYAPQNPNAPTDLPDEPHTED